MQKLILIEMKIGVIVAMDKELQQLQHLFDNSRIIVEKCGIGKVNAAIGASEMIRKHRPDVIISSGCAGGNGNDINVQDVVVGKEVSYHDVYCGTAIDDTTIYGQVQGMPARYQADAMLLEKARSLSLTTSHISLHEGLIVTGDWFVDSKDKMRSIIEKFPGGQSRGHGERGHCPDLSYLQGAVHLFPRYQRHSASRYRCVYVSRLLGYHRRELVPSD